MEDNTTVVDAHVHLQNIQIAFRRPFINANLWPEGLLDLVSVFGEKEVKVKHPLIEIVFEYLEKYQGDDRYLVSAVTQHLISTIVSVFRCGSFDTHKYSLELFYHRFELITEYSKKPASPRLFVNGEYFNKEMTSLVEFYRFWNGDVSDLRGVCDDKVPLEPQLDKCREIIEQERSTKILEVICRVVETKLKRLTRDKLSEKSLQTSVNQENIPANLQGATKSTKAKRRNGKKR
jgi:hypothetical protein